MDEKRKDKGNGDASFGNSTTQLANGVKDGAGFETDFDAREEDSWDSNKVLRNLIVVSFAFFLLFTAFMVSMWRSSIDVERLPYVICNL